MTVETVERYQVYAGFSELLNRRSYKDYDKDLFVLKFGYSKSCEETDWERRMREGFPGDGSPPISCPLALYEDWSRIAVVEVDGANRLDTKSRAKKGIEKPLLAFLKKEFEMPPIAADVKREMMIRHEDLFPGKEFESNGVGELRRLPWRKVPSFVEAASNGRFNDPLAKELVDLVGRHVELQLTHFARSLEAEWKTAHVAAECELP